MTGPRAQTEAEDKGSCLHSFIGWWIHSFLQSFISQFMFMHSFVHESVRLFIHLCASIYWNLNEMRAWIHLWGSWFFNFPCGSVCRTHRISAPIPPPEPVPRSEERVHSRGSVQPLLQRLLLGKTLPTPVSLWGRLSGVSGATAWGLAPLHVHKVAAARSSSRDGGESEKEGSVLYVLPNPHASWLPGCHPRPSERENPGHRIKSPEGLAGWPGRLWLPRPRPPRLVSVSTVCELGIRDRIAQCFIVQTWELNRAGSKFPFSHLRLLCAP